MKKTDFFKSWHQKTHHNADFGVGFTDLSNKSTKFAADNYPTGCSSGSSQEAFGPMAGIYVHIPFCKTRCIYCDFFSTTLRGKGRDYVRALSQEIAERKDFLHESVTTLYIGGGTPSQLEPEAIRDLLDAIGQHFDLSQCEEITMEMNPEDVASGAFSVRNLPINRVSMGVQSMVDAELKLLNRRHDSARVRIAVSRLREEGIRNLSLDLMYGLPTQTLESWAYSIDEVLKLKPEHISAYNLMVEEGTQLYALVEEGKLQPGDDELCLEMAALLRQRLQQAGYEQYEISNYALPGFHSRHNSSYWVQTPYLGLGPGAHSYDGQRLRCWNEPDINAYLCGERQEGQEILSDEDLYNERIMLGLRTRWGVAMEVFAPYQKETKGAIASLLSRQLVEIKDDHLVLSKSGMALGDQVVRELMVIE